MNPLVRSLVLAILALFVWLPGIAQAQTQQLFGVSNTGALVTINTTNGTVTTVGPGNPITAIGLAFRPTTQKLYTFNPTTSTFSELDATTGLVVGTPIAVQGLPALTGGAFAFNAAGTGYFADTSAPPNFFQFDIDAGTMTTITPPVGFPAAILGLAFSSSGQLFATSAKGNDLELYTIDTTTGAATLIGTDLNTQFAQGLGALAFDTSGGLWASVGSVGGPSRICNIDVLTGKISNNTGVSLTALAGIAWGNGTVQPPSAAITLSKQTAAVTEAGATDSYTIVLASAPTANVTINLTSSAQLSVTPPTLTFDTQNWATPQTITIAAMDDTLAEGTHTAIIAHDAISTDTNYNLSGFATMTVTITDNDGGGTTPGGGTTTPGTGPIGLTGEGIATSSPQTTVPQPSAGEGQYLLANMSPHLYGPYVPTGQNGLSSMPVTSQPKGDVLVFNPACNRRAATTASDVSLVYVLTLAAAALGLLAAGIAAGVWYRTAS